MKHHQIKCQTYTRVWGHTLRPGPRGQNTFPSVVFKIHGPPLDLNSSPARWAYNLPPVVAQLHCRPLGPKYSAVRWGKNKVPSVGVQIRGRPLEPNYSAVRWGKNTVPSVGPKVCRRLLRKYAGVCGCKKTTQSGVQEYRLRS